MHARNPDNRHGTSPTRIDIGDLHVHINDPAMKAIYGRAQQLAEDRLPVLITGESGVGKEIVARALHHFSPWASGPFVAVNCGGLPPTLIETELFGHEKGAFSGAVGAKLGLIESAAGGTLLLDEIGELPLEMQTRLLRVLDRRESRRVGGVQSRQLDLRIVAATNRDVVAEVAAGRFRSDLLFRLKGSTIVVPPLRERLDIPGLAGDLLDAACARRNRAPLTISSAALFAVLRYTWPGNVRELKHAMEWAALAAVTSPSVELEHLPE
jgi:two-component system response regulator AtoC